MRSHSKDWQRVWREGKGWVVQRVAALLPRRPQALVPVSTRLVQPGTRDYRKVSRMKRQKEDKTGGISNGALENATAANSGALRAISEGNSDIVASENRAGRPTKYEPETVERLLTGIADGLTQKQACIASGICENTLAAWREKHPELEERLTQAREQARQKALAGIRAAGEGAKGDWRALAEFLRLSFQADYRRDASVNVSAAATVQRTDITCDEETRKKLIELREKIQAPVPGTTATDYVQGKEEATSE